MSPRIALLSLGGTIDAVGADRLDLAFYAETGKRLGQGELVRRLPESSAIAEVDELVGERLSSHAFSPQHWTRIADSIQRAADGDYDGIVVAHGTDTLEETAYYLHLVLGTTKPVVLVGAMRPPSALGADGDLNLMDAIRVAADPRSHGRGVLVVLAGTIHSARFVTKATTYGTNAFASRGGGPLGYVNPDGSVLFVQQPIAKHTTETAFALGSALPRVDIVVSYAGADGAAVDAFVAAGASGVVSAGTGAGWASPAEEAALSRARAQGVVVCQATRVGSGRVLPGPRLARLGFIAAGDLQPWRARVLLSVALAKTRDLAELQEIFETY